MVANQDRAPRSDATLTIIAPGTRIEGEIASSGVVKVEGTVVGTVRAERQVLVAKGGVVEGDIQTVEAVVGGRVQGGISASERVEVQGGATVHGDVSTKSLVVQEGGEINGVVKMTNSRAEPPAR